MYRYYMDIYLYFYGKICLILGTCVHSLLRGESCFTSLKNSRNVKKNISTDSRNILQSV